MDSINVSSSPAIKSEIAKRAEGFLLTWNKIRQILAKELSEQSFKTWLEPVRCLDLTEQSITLGVPDNYYGQWLKTHYENLISSSLAEVLGAPREIL